MTLRTKLVAIIAAFVFVGIPVAAIAAVISTGTYLLPVDQVQPEDVYVVATVARVDGVIEGDLVIAASSVVIGGTVEGDVLVATQGTVRVDGTVTGSLRGVARSVEITGSVGDDAAVVAYTTAVSGSVGRDLLPVAVRTRIAGEIGRDVRGRSVWVAIDGETGRDVDMTVHSFQLNDGGVVGGDLITRSSNAAEISDGATVGGQIVEIPGRSGFFVEIVLRLATLVGVLSMIAGGIVLLWLAPTTTGNAIQAVTARPLMTLLTGFAVMVVAPVATVLLAFTLVGIPFALMMVLLGVVAWFYGAVPVLAVVGSWMLRGRASVYAGFVVAAIVWRLASIFIPWVGVAILLLGLAWGTGAWVVGIWETRRDLASPAATAPEVEAAD